MFKDLLVRLVALLLRTAVGRALGRIVGPRLPRLVAIARHLPKLRNLAFALPLLAAIAAGLSFVGSHQESAATTTEIHATVPAPAAEPVHVLAPAPAHREIAPTQHPRHHAHHGAPKRHHARQANDDGADVLNRRELDQLAK